MKISIITVCFNAAETLADTLDSVASQNYPDIEHIVIDGDSSDGTRALLESGRGRVALWKSEPDRGIYDAMNKGLVLASGEVIGFLNADDVYFSDDVLQQVAAVFEDSTVDACYADLVYVDAINIQRVVRYWRSGSFKPGMFKRGWMPAHPTFFVRKAVYEKCGGVGPGHRLAGGFFFSLPLL